MKTFKILLIIIILFSQLSIMNGKILSASNKPKAITEGTGQVWDKQSGGSSSDSFSSVIETSDGGFVAVGSSQSDADGTITSTNNGQNDGLIVKFNRDGNQLWDKQIGGSSSDQFYSVIETSDGGFVAVGSSQSDADGTITSTNNGFGDGLIVKFDENGNQIWDNQVGGSSFDQFFSVLETSDGGFVAVGSSQSYQDGTLTSPNNGGTDGLVVKFDENGNQIWDYQAGGSSSEFFFSVLETSDGGIVAVGSSQSDADGTLTSDNNGDSDGLIVKFDENGNQLWDKQIGGWSTETFNSVVETSDNGLIAVGSSKSTISGNLTSDNNGDNDGLIVKFDEAGNKVWDKQVGGSFSDNFNSVIETSDRGLVAEGYSGSNGDGTLTSINNGGNDGLIVKFDEDGNQLWDKQIGGSDLDNFSSVIETRDEGLVAVGYSKSNGDGTLTSINNGATDGLVVKLDFIAPTITVDQALTVEVGSDVPIIDDYLQVMTIIDNITLLEDMEIIIDDQGLDMSTIGEYEVKIIATDEAGNKSEETITVDVADLTAPTITVNEEITVKVGSDAPTIGDYKNVINVSDNVTATEDIEIIIDDQGLDMSTAGEYEVKVIATDEAGNKSEAIVIVNVEGSINKDLGISVDQNSTNNRIIQNTGSENMKILLIAVLNIILLSLIKMRNIK